MATNASVRSVLEKYAREEVELSARLAAITNEIDEIRARIKEVRVVREALETASGMSASDLAIETPAPAPKADKPARSTAKARPGKRRRGRRKSARKGGAGASSLHDMGIVEAAISLAQQKGVTEASAGDILAWFEEVGYQTRNGTPTRNSVYVSLNREFTEGQRDDRPTRITRPARGRFVFHYDTADSDATDA